MNLSMAASFSLNLFAKSARLGSFLMIDIMRLVSCSFSFKRSLSILTSKLRSRILFRKITFTSPPLYEGLLFRPVLVYTVGARQRGIITDRKGVICIAWIEKKCIPVSELEKYRKDWSTRSFSYWVNNPSGMTAIISRKFKLVGKVKRK